MREGGRSVAIQGCENRASHPNTAAETEILLDIKAPFVSYRRFVGDRDRTDPATRRSSYLECRTDKWKLGHDGS